MPFIDFTYNCSLTQYKQGFCEKVVALFSDWARLAVTAKIAEMSGIESKNRK